MFESRRVAVEKVGESEYEHLIEPPLIYESMTEAGQPGEGASEETEHEQHIQYLEQYRRRLMGRCSQATCPGGRWTSKRGCHLPREQARYAWVFTGGL